jgi:hypothetical protein
VFTARYALSPYIKQIRFFFKGLTYLIVSLGQGHTQGGAAVGLQPPPVPQNRDSKNTDFVDIMISTFYVIYTTAEISDWNRLMTSTLEFWKIN